MKKVIIVLLLNMFIISPAFAKFEDREHGPWTVEQSDDICVMSMTYEDDTIVFILRKFYENKTEIVFSNSKWQSLKSRDGTIRVEINFRGNIDRKKFTTDEASILIAEYNEGDSITSDIVLIAEWGGEDSDKLMTSLALAFGFNLEIDGKNLGGFSLDDSRKAVLSMAECRLDGRRNSNIDPFAK